MVAPLHVSVVINDVLASEPEEVLGDGIRRSWVSDQRQFRASDIWSIHFVAAGEEYRRDAVVLGVLENGGADRRPLRRNPRHRLGRTFRVRCRRGGRIGGRSLAFENHRPMMKPAADDIAARHVDRHILIAVGQYSSHDVGERHLGP